MENYLAIYEMPMDADSSEFMDDQDEISSEVLKLLKKSERLVKGILESNITEYSMRIVQSRYELKCTLLGKRILEVLRDHCERLEHEFPKHFLNPLLTLLIAHVKRNNIPLLIENYGVGRFYCDQELTRWIKVLNDLIQGMRDEAKTKEFRKATRNYFLRGKNNYKSLSNLIRNLFKKYSRLMVLRIDLKYRDHLKDGDLIKRAAMTFEAARTHRERFFTNMRSNAMFDHIVGWAWKLEYGLRSGFHYHVILFFHGKHVRQDVTSAKRICAYWDNFITRGKGKAHSCNAKKEKYDECGIGMINHDESAKLIGLDKAVMYLTKSDFYFQLMTGGRNRGFGRKEIKRPERIETRGRPRNTSLVAESVINCSSSLT